MKPAPKKMKTPIIIISRNYVEFGPFTGAELVDFRARGILNDGDFVRTSDSETWLTLPEYVSSLTVEAAPVAKKAKAAAPKAAAKTAAPRRSKAA